MKYTAIFKNGKIDTFYLLTSKKESNAILNNYFLDTDIDHTKLGNIKDLNILYGVYDLKTKVVYYGKQSHGWGYASCHDVYTTLLQHIIKTYKNDLTRHDIQQLQSINTDNEELTIKPALLDKLEKLTEERQAKKYFD